MATVERRRYRKILTRMHADDKFRQLSKPQPNGQSLWQYLLTGPHTTAVPGLFVVGEAALAEALEWPIDGFRAAWREIEQLEMATADWKARVVWLPNAIRHNAPESPNVVKGWRDAVDQVPECDLKWKALAQLEAFLAWQGQAFAKAFAEAFRRDAPQRATRPLANQEQEQEQDLKSVSAATSATPLPLPTQPAFLTFPIVGPGTGAWPLTEAKLAEWAALFPGLDLRSESRKALAWVMANPRNRKTATGMDRFLVSWFTRSTNRGVGRFEARPAGGNEPRRTVPSSDQTRAFIQRQKGA